MVLFPRLSNSFTEADSFFFFSIIDGSLIGQKRNEYLLPFLSSVLKIFFQSCFGGNLDTGFKSKGREMTGKLATKLPGGAARRKASQFRRPLRIPPAS